MQNPENPNPYGGPNNPYAGYNPYVAQPPEGQHQAFGGPVTQDERNMAMLAHLLQMFTGFLGPLIIYLIKKGQSKFVAYHALQALVWQIGYMVVTGVGFGLVFVSMFVGSQHATNGFPIFFILFGLLSAGAGLLNFVLGIIYTIKANNGDWSGYPIIGEWVRRFV